MKLLVVSSWLPYPLDNGSRVRAYHLLRELSRRHAVTLLAFGTLRGDDDLAPLRAMCQEVEVVAPVAVDRRRLGLRGLFSPVPRYFVQRHHPSMEGLVAQHLSRHDAAVAFQVEAALYVRPWRQVPRLFEEAEVAVAYEQVTRAPDVCRRARHRLTWAKFRRFVRDLVHEVDHTTVVSEPERALLGAMGCDPARVSVVPNGVEAPAAPPAAHRARRLVYPGSVVYEANLDAVRWFVDDILPRVRATAPDVELWVTGATSGVDVTPLERPGVRFTGVLPEVDSLVASSAAVVVPLRIGGGTRLKVLQAMALGTPVVSTSKGVEGLDVEADGHLRVADTPASFAEAIVRLLDQPAPAREMAARAQALVRERYAWPKSGEALEAALARAVETWRERRGLR